MKNIKIILIITGILVVLLLIGGYFYVLNKKEINMKNFDINSGGPRVKFGIAAKVHEATVRASVTFEVDGFVQLDPTGWVKVNGESLAGAPFGKQGYWYVGDVPQADRYQLEYALRSGQSIERSTILARRFIPDLPTSVSRSRSLAVYFEGPALRTGERIFAEITSREMGSARWGTPLDTTATENEIAVSSQSLAKARGGEAVLYVGVVAQESSVAQQTTTTYAIGREQLVQIVD